MKNILLLVHDDAGQEARLQAALDITRALSGHLNCLDVAVVSVVVGELWTGAGGAVLIDDESGIEAGNRTRIESRLAHEGVAWSWTDATGDPAICIEQASLLNELIVVNRRLDDAALNMRSIASELIVHGGKPVLAVPEKASGLNVAGRALVLWNGSAQAEAALQAAVPLLRLASAVTIFEADDGSIKAPAEDAAAFLSRHGIHARVARVRARIRPAGRVILEAIRRRHSDYVVMGGFGRSRAAEAVFGGVTRKLLDESPVPLFIAH